ncbi:hypothetical protein [Desulfoscipio geothermicus]|uniref:Lipoprotein n=1 Tax=Desulfoscipio geothermicus DSM 3669 TaxID=1121426 RepID=A0A1I6CRG4_9FIRM|nr:hypothetical protein [Desulfoscipio geothermicus]SFQ95771.1 hypothetical protein SAMN05660706_101248 [Desulfoscipio geothermicus DSM 3669]
MRGKIILLYFVIMLVLAGCSLYNAQPAEKEAAKQQKQPTRSRPEVGSMQVAEPVPGQKENPVLAPADYTKIVTGISQAVDVFVDSLLVNDLKNATACLYGLDEEGGALTLEELQRQVELLHPVQWQVTSCRPAGREGMLAALSFTLPDGTVCQTGFFSVRSDGNLWTIHYNSFTDSFNAMARHLLDRSEPTLSEE